VGGGRDAHRRGRAGGRTRPSGADPAGWRNEENRLILWRGTSTPAGCHPVPGPGDTGILTVVTVGNPMQPPERSSAPQRGPRPGGARWCEEHQRWECTRPRSKGRGTCHGIAIAGLDKCRMHAGVKGEVAKAQGQAVITAWNAMGAAPDIDYRMAVLGVL